MRVRLSAQPVQAQRIRDPADHGAVPTSCSAFAQHKTIQNAQVEEKKSVFSETSVSSETSAGTWRSARLPDLCADGFWQGLGLAQVSNRKLAL